MIHQFAAAILCTVGLVLFAFEIINQPQDRSAHYFSIFYSIAMIGWIILGCVIDSASLVTIGSIQFGSALFLFFRSLRRSQ